MPDGHGLAGWAGGLAWSGAGAGLGRTLIGGWPVRRWRQRGGTLPAVLEAVAIAVHLQDMHVVGEGVLATMLKRAVHPGDVLRDELEERGVSPASFARQIDVPANRISQILAGKRAVTGDSALSNRRQLLLPLRTVNIPCLLGMATSSRWIRA